MLKKDYKDIIDPITDQVIEHFMLNESKHCEGLRCTGKDISKVVSHSVKSLLGDTNPDGVSHAVAALSRAYKAVLYEQTQGKKFEKTFTNVNEFDYQGERFEEAFTDVNEFDYKIGMTKAGD